jgi:DNA-binding MarR family transcriptional regulator
MEMRARDEGRSTGQGYRLISELRTFMGRVERYMGDQSQMHHMHRTDLAALALIMDGKATTPTQISKALGLSPSATSAMLSRLEQAGHVVRSQMPDNRRSVHIEVTDTARDVGRSMFGVLGRHMAPVLAQHSEQELARMADLMAQLVEAADRARDDVRGRLDGSDGNI